MLTHTGSVAWSETLEGLHVPAWWTGLRLVAADGWNTAYRVRMILPNGQLPFPGAEWTQVSGDWHPFPWPLPAQMATAMGLQLIIKPTQTVPARLATAVKIAYQEMPLMLERDHYLFCDDEGELVLQWNGSAQTWGTPELGAPPAWRSLHTVVPTTKWLRHMPWPGTPFCVHEWAERVPMPRL